MSLNVVDNMLSLKKVECKKLNLLKQNDEEVYFLCFCFDLKYFLERVKYSENVVLFMSFFLWDLILVLSLLL
jgi:hypothetical protein